MPFPLLRSNSTLSRLLVVGILALLLFSGCASRPAPPAAGPSGDTEAPPPTDLTAAAALAFAEAADDGSAAFCAPGRYTVITAEGPAFAMVSWGDQLALTLLDGEGTPEQRAAIEAELTRHGADTAGTVTLSLSPAASGARYTGPDATASPPDAGLSGPDSSTTTGSDSDTPPLLFWSKGDRALILLGDLTFVDAEVRPL